MQKVCHVSHYATIAHFSVFFPSIVANKAVILSDATRKALFSKNGEVVLSLWNRELFPQETAVEGEGEELLNALENKRPLCTVKQDAHRAS